MSSNRFSKQAVIQRYLKDKHGYALMLVLFCSIHSFIDGPYDLSGPGGIGYSKLSRLLVPIFGGHSVAALFFIFSILLIIYIELVVFNSNQIKENQK